MFPPDFAFPARARPLGALARHREQLNVLPRACQSARPASRRGYARQVIIALQHKVRHTTVQFTVRRHCREDRCSREPIMAVAQIKPSAAPLKDLYEIGEIPPLGHVPANMYAWAIRKERHGPPETAMQLEVVPTWPIDEDEVLVYVMAGGVNYNGVWAGLGAADLAARRAQESVPRRRFRCVGHRLGGRLEGEALEGRRRSHHSLQSGRRRRRGMQWRRPAAVAVAAHLGLRNAGRLVRAILPRAVAPADAQAAASDLGRIPPATR